MFKFSAGLLTLLFLSVPAVFSQKSATPYENRKYAAATIIAGTQDMVKELALKHPGFYRYNTPATFGHYIDSVLLTINDSLTELQIYRKLKPVISKTGCLHTGLSLSDTLTTYLNGQANLFPFQVYFEQQRAYIIKNYSGEAALMPGTEITSINGRSVPEILQVLLPAIPSDGYNTSMKYLALYHSFCTWYRNIIEATDNFSVTVIKAGHATPYTVKAARYADLATSGFLNETVYPTPLDFTIENNTGLLTIHTFSNSAIKRGGQDFQKFIRNAFRTLNAAKVPHLIVDLRYNTGGSDGNAAYFSGYFFDAPYRYWNRIEVTEAIARDIKGKYTLFYRKPIQKDSTWLWQKGRTTHDFDFYEMQLPAKDHYTGKVYVLINGFCMSSCADVSAVLAHNKKAVFIGEETGGGYQGNNSGMIPVTTVSPAGLRVTVPLQKYYTAVDAAVNTGRGTLPDYQVWPSVNDLITGQDVVLSFARDLVKKNP